MYLWQSTGGCQYCDAQGGYHLGAEPPRQHSNCLCEITPADRVPWNEARYDARMELVGWFEKDGTQWRKITREKPGTAATMYARIRYRVNCIHEDRVTSGTFEIAQKRSAWKAAAAKLKSGDSSLVQKLLDEYWSKAAAKVQAIGDSMNCKPPMIA